MLRLNEILREQDNGDNGGDGGGQKPLSEEEVGKLVNASVNAAVTSHLKRSLGPAITEALGSLKLDEKIAAALKAQPAPEPQPGGQNEPPKPDPRIAALEARYADLEKHYKAEQEARTAAELKSRETAARGALRTALEPHITGAQLDIASRYLFDAQQFVTFDDDGTPLVKSKRAPMRGMPEEEVLLPIADGVNEWLKSEEAKIFLPPPKPLQGKQTPGAPTLRGAPRPQPDPNRSDADSEDEKLQRAYQREQELAQRYGIT